MVNDGGYLSRRGFVREASLGIAAASATVIGIQGARGDAVARPASKTPGGGSLTAYAGMRGFNYNPSYCTTLYEMWDRFDRKVWEAEIKRGKEYFPKLNCLRIWMDMNPYLRDRTGFVKNAAWMLDLCGGLGIKVMPTLFNRWHDYTYDFTGVYIDQFMDRAFQRFGDYVRDVVSAFKDDARIMMWDLCNEPGVSDPNNPLHQVEVDWLKWVAGQVRQIGAKQPITIGTMAGSNVALLEPVCDVICIHPYGGWWDNGYVEACDWAVRLAQSKGKPLIANETCQGSLKDDVRATIIRTCLGALKQRGIGWCAWQLHGGRMLSANRQIMDSNCRPGDRAYMAFIEPDGKLRPGHEAFNEF